jgi:hypothetical protein
VALVSDGDVLLTIGIFPIYWISVIAHSMRAFKHGFSEMPAVSAAVPGTVVRFP